MISKGGKPKASGAVFKYTDHSIIEFYKSKALGILNYYRCSTNYHAVKKLVDYHMRWSLIHTLAGKHLKKVHQIISQYGKSPEIKVLHKDKLETLVKFLTPSDINNRKKGFIMSYDPRTHYENFDKPIVRLSVPKALFEGGCAVQGCTNDNIEVHHVRALKRTRKGFTIESISNKGKSIKGLSMIESALKRKQIPLCKKHHAE